jgi:GntR family transcriptional regulator of gluconate operon
MREVLFARLESTGLKEQIQACLRQAILDGSLSPGQKLIEGEIAQQFGVSRSPVREAIQELERQGYVVKRPRRGTFVTELTPQDVVEIYSLRVLLEGYAAAIAGGCCAPEMIDRMTGLVDRMKDAVRRADFVDFSDADLEFHTLLCRATGHERLLYLSGCLRTQLGFLAVLPKYSLAEVERLVADHEQLVTAIRAHEPERARQIIDGHIRTAGRLFLEKHFGLDPNAGQIPEAERMTSFWAAAR